MFRTLNADAFNEIANDTRVRPFLGNTGVLDLSNLVNNVSNFCFLTDCKRGGHILIARGNGVYEVHTLSLPEVRGKLMLKLMKDARAFMFLQTDCIELQTFVPDEQTTTLLWAKLAGFREEYHRYNCFNFNGKLIGGSYWRMDYRDWVLKDHANQKSGEHFHAQIEPFELVTHDHDPIHDAWAGSVCRAAVASSQNLPKAISYYNMWAARCGYAQLQIVSIAPFVLWIGNALLQRNADHSLSVLKVNDKCLSEPQLVLVSPV